MANLQQGICKRYAIVRHFQDEGTQTLEDYDCEQGAREAFEYIRENGVHRPENDSDEVVTIDEDVYMLSMDVEVFDAQMSPMGFETIEHEPILFTIISAGE